MKLVDQLTYLGNNISSTKSNVNIRIGKASTVINRLSTVWKMIFDKIKQDFFQAVTVSVLLYGFMTWTLTKRLKKKLDGNYTKMPRAVLNKSSGIPAKQ